MKSKEVLEIEAYIYGEKIGTLLFDSSKIYFSYTPEFKSKNLQISPMKLNTHNIDEIYTNNDSSIYQGMPGVFFDSLPDKFGMSFIDRYFESEGYKISDITLLHRLSFIGDRGMGAIEYRPKEEKAPFEEFDKVLTAKSTFENMQAILSHQEESYSVEELMEVLHGASPLGGGRPKMLISFNKDTQEIRTNDKTLRDGFTRSIIKFDESYYENESIEFTKLEYIYMNMAKDCEINIPDILLYREDGMHHLIIERFDRDKEDNKIHVVTASGLLHKDISIPKVMSYEELFSLTNKICHKQSSIDELFRRMVFNTLSFNVDDHAKNFSFMMDKKGEWDIAPGYDITYSYGMVKEHLTTINGKGKDFILQDYLDIAKINLIKERDAISIIRKIIGVLETFEYKAKMSSLSIGTTHDCLSKIQSQLDPIKREISAKLIYSSF